MFKLSGYITNKVYLTAKTKSELMQLAINKFPANSTKYPGGSSVNPTYMIYPEPLMVKKV